MEKRFGTAINCMDGRAQEPVIGYMQENFGADYVDMVTEPGPNRILSEGKDIGIIESLRKRVGISVEKHGSQVIAVVGHYDCAGNPEDEEVQREDLRKAVEVISSWGFPVKRVIALWLDENFNPSVIC